jgi:hypothetical protein
VEHSGFLANTTSQHFYIVSYVKFRQICWQLWCGWWGTLKASEVPKQTHLFTVDTPHATATPTQYSTNRRYVSLFTVRSNFLLFCFVDKIYNWNCTNNPWQGDCYGFTLIERSLRINNSLLYEYFSLLFCNEIITRRCLEISGSSACKYVSTY